VTPGFQQAVERLYGLERSRHKLGLDGTRSLLAALGNPERRFRSVHVAGTNGKGSVAALVERVLREAGHRTGLYTSPHLVDFRERIRVAGRWVDSDWLERRLARIQELPEGRDRTFFEVATALAFDDFAEQRVEIAVVEVGLGGRLDCTNVLEPEVCAITRIGLDHTEILGETLEQIAFEKAGIVKAGVPVVERVGSDVAERVIAEVAASVGAPLVPAARRAAIAGDVSWPSLQIDTRAWGRLGLDAGPLWPLASDNAMVALAVLDVLEERGWTISREAVLEGCRRVRWPGRLEPCPTEPRLWWDGAHNPMGMEGLREAWRALAMPPPSAVVLALSDDKPAERMLEPLAELSQRGRLIVTRSRNARSMDPERLAAIAASAGWSAESAPNVPAACTRALPGASRERPVLLTGSLFAVGEAMELLGGAPGEWL
jgi:dihydrofolate synthase/folylpolyglutamate synthase